MEKKRKKKQVSKIKVEKLAVLGKESFSIKISELKIADRYSEKRKIE